MKFYECEICGNIIEYVKDVGVEVECCGQPVTEIVPGTSDGAAEKHVPVVTTEGNRVTVEVGAAEHPMTEEHFIEWILIETEKGCQKVELKPGQPPKAEFYLAPGDVFVTAYEYCNIHGLWKN